MDGMAYVGLCPQCRKIEGTVGSDPVNGEHRRNVRHQVTRWADRGQEIQTLTYEDVRSGEWCSCQRDINGDLVLREVKA